MQPPRHQARDGSRGLRLSEEAQPADGAGGTIRMFEDLVVHVIDDDAAVRHSLEFLLHSAGIAVRTYASGIAFLGGIPELHTGCILTDIRMPALDGIALQRKLTELDVRLPVIMITGHGDVPLAVQALKAGALDFIEKPFDDERLLSAVRNALEVSRCTQAQSLEVGAAAARLAKLTPRERQVLEGLVAGHSNQVIACDLGASPRTIEVHRARVMEKMHVRSLPELTRMVLMAHRTLGP
jgi:two-component system, LuxR family, response regulator FixJ